MHAELLQMAADLTRRQEPFVLALVVRRRPASSAQAGDMAIITAGGDFHGWLGGSCIQPTVLREARRVLASGKPRLLALTPDPETEQRPGVAVFPMTCHSGGSVEIYLEPIQPAPRLAVFGESPTARALARLGAAMGYNVTPVDIGAASPAAGGAACFAVVATMGEDDEAAIRAALALAPAYLGVVASARRFAQMRPALLAQGISEAQLATIRSPAGLAIQAQTPEEIALSVLAEIVERRHALAAGSGTAAAAPAAADTQPSPPAAGQAIDPICGMTVQTAGARHTAEHAGRVFYFCCAGCRARFVAAPERHTAMGGAA
jgi:xanthine dehydrogenase accessory factor